MTLSTVTQIAAILLVIIQVLPTNSFTSSRLSTFTQHHDSTYAYVHLLHTKNNNNKSNLIQLHSSASGDESKSNKEGISIGIRLNKVFKATHSRRAADDIIASGRVSINGEPVLEKGGCKVIPFQDIVSLDGKVIKGWEQMNAIDRNTYNNDNQNTRARDGGDLKTSSFEYVKYFKPLGVTCTTDLSIEGNIIDTIQRDGYRPRHRVYPVGRLDKDTSGLIILTSDGRMVNAVLRGEKKQPKIYKVMVDWELEDHHLQQLRDGITIRTVAQNKRRTEQENTLIAKTKKCEVERIGPCSCQMTLVEGRNRQIRKMMHAMGFRVVRLHRVEFMGIQVSKGLNGPGDWAYLDAEEMKLVKNALRSAQEENSEESSW